MTIMFCDRCGQEISKGNPIAYKPDGKSIKKKVICDSCLSYFNRFMLGDTPR